MPNCRPGDLAIIHGLTKDTEHNGRIVVATQPLETDEDGLWWAVQPETFNHEGLLETYNDRNLKPIRGTGKLRAVTHHTSDKQTA